MDTFAFLIHPLVMQDVYDYAPEVAHRDPKLVKAIMKKWLPPFPIKRFEITSLIGRQIEGLVILVPLLPEQFLEPDQGLCLEKVLAAGRMAEEMGAKLLGLGALTAVVGRNGKVIADRMDIGVTTGNSYTAAVAVESLLEAAREMDIRPETAKLTIVGATGSIGSACARLLSPLVATVTLVARQIESLKRLSQEIGETLNPYVVVEADLRKAVRDADLILLATTAPGAILDVDDVRPGAVVADVSKPHNVDFDQRFGGRDVLLIDAGLVCCPEKRVIEVIDRRFPYVPGIDSERIFSCFAETMILAFEGHFEDYSIGRHLDLSQVREVAEAGAKHGFSIQKVGATA